MTGVLKACGVFSETEQNIASKAVTHLPPAMPNVLALAVQGFHQAISTLFNILIRLSPFFFIFSAGTNSHYVNSAIQTGQAEYKATGRGFVIQHVRMNPNGGVRGEVEASLTKSDRNVYF